MGNINTKDIKRASVDLIGMYPERFRNDFENNKTVMKELKVAGSTIVRNKVAGRITRILKRRERDSKNKS